MNVHDACYSNAVNHVIMYVGSYKITVLLLSTNWWWIVIFNYTFKCMKINLQWVLTLTFKTVLHPTITVYSTVVTILSLVAPTQR